MPASTPRRPARPAHVPAAAIYDGVSYRLLVTDRQGRQTDTAYGTDLAIARAEVARTRAIIEGVLPGEHTYQLRAIHTWSLEVPDYSEDGEGAITRVFKLALAA